MAASNLALGAPDVTLEFWAGAVGGNQSLLHPWEQNLCARAVVVGNPAGNLLLVDIYGTTHTFSAAHIIASGSILRGQWTQATAAGSASTDLIAWW